MPFSLQHGFVHKLIFLYSPAPSLPPLSITSSPAFSLGRYGNTVLYVSFSNEMVLSDGFGCHIHALLSDCRVRRRGRKTHFLLLQCFSSHLNTGQSIWASLEMTSTHSQWLNSSVYLARKWAIVRQELTTWLDGARACPCVCGLVIDDGLWTLLARPQAPSLVKSALVDESRGAWCLCFCMCFVAVDLPVDVKPCWQE